MSLTKGGVKPEHIRIIVASPSEFIAKGIDAVLCKSSAYQLGDHYHSISEMESRPSLDGDVLLLDAGIHTSLERRKKIVHRLSRTQPKLKVIIFNGIHDVPNRVITMLEAGASGFISRHCENNFENAINEVMTGTKYLCPLSTRAVANAVIKHSGDEKAVKLTNREKTVVKLLAREYYNYEIAEQLGVSVSTVETFRRNIFKKLGVRSLAGVALYAVKHGLVEV